MFGTLSALYNYGKTLFNQPQTKAVSAPLNVNQAFSSGGLTTQGSQYGPPTLNLPKALSSGGLTVIPSVLGAATTQKTTGSGGGNGGSAPTPVPTPTQPQYQDISADELNGLYGGANAQLDQNEQSLRGQLPVYLQQVQSLADQQNANVDTQQKNQQGVLDQQKQETQQAQGNYLQQAAQLFNELGQYYGSRFGAGSSAGPAALELLSRSTQQNMGGINQTAENNLQKIQESGRQLADFVTKQKTSIAQQVKDKTQEIQQWFQDQLASINTNRAMLEADKASKRYELLQNRQNFFNQLNAQQAQYNMALDNFIKEQSASLADIGNKTNSYGVPITDASNIAQMYTNGALNVPRINQPNTEVYYGANAQGQPFSETRAAPVTYGSTNSLNKSPYAYINGRLVDENGNAVA